MVLLWTHEGRDTIVAFHRCAFVVLTYYAAVSSLVFLLTCQRCTCRLFRGQRSCTLYACALCVTGFFHGVGHMFELLRNFHLRHL